MRRAAARRTRHAFVLLLAVIAVPLAPAGVATAGPIVAPAAMPAASGPTPGDIVPGHFLVRFEARATKNQRAAARALLGSRPGRAIGIVPGLELIEADLAPAEAARRLRGRPGVLSIEPDRFVAAEALPNDPSFSESWALRDDADHDIDAPEAWTITHGDPSIVIAVIDSGVALDHPDLAANRWANQDEIAGNGLDDDDNGYIDDLDGWDWVDDDADPADEFWHGTHVAGIAAAVGNNGEGSIGVASGSRIMGLRMLGPTGFGMAGDAVAAIDYAVRNGARVINLSWSYSDGIVQPLVDVIVAAGRAGVVVVASAGNSGWDLDAEPSYPAAIDAPGLISVAAVERTDALWAASNRGRATVDLAAPGVDIYATVPAGGYSTATGTSMAAPHVAGVAALLLSEHPEWSASQVRSRIMQTVRPLASLRGKVASGGTLDAAAALTGVVDKPPVVTITSPAPGTSVLPKTLVTLSATAIDAVDGDVSDSIVWVSSRQGKLGEGPSIVRIDLATGTHLITATAADNVGHHPVRAVSLRVGPLAAVVDRPAVDDMPVIAVTDAGVPTIAYRRIGRGTYAATPSGSGWTRTLVGPSEDDRWLDIALDGSDEPRIAVMRSWSATNVFADPGIMVHAREDGAWHTDRASFVCIGGDDGCGRDWTPSIVIDEADREHIAMVRSEAFMSDGSNDPVQGVVYLRRLPNGGWATEFVDVITDGHMPSIALAPDGSIHIAYLRNGSVAPGIWHATNESGTWIRRRLSTSALHGWPRVGVDPTGRVRVAISSPSAVSLRTRTGTTWDTWVTVRSGRAGELDMAIDATGKVHLGVGLADANQSAVGVAYVTSTGGTWTSRTIEGGQAVLPSLAVDGAGKVHLTYRAYSASPGVRYATNRSGSWVVTTAAAGRDDGPPAYAIDGRGVAHALIPSWGVGDGIYYGTNETGSWALTNIKPLVADIASAPGLAVSSTGEAHAVYTTLATPDGTDLPDPAVWYATNTSGTWKAIRLGAAVGHGDRPILLDAAGRVHILFVGREAGSDGIFYATNMTGTMVVHRIASGVYEVPAFALDPGGKVHVAAVRITPAPDYTRQLRYLTNAGGGWANTLLQTGAPFYEPAIAIDPEGDPVVAYWAWEGGVHLDERIGSAWSTRTVTADTAAAWADLVIDADGTRRVAYTIATGDYNRCRPLPMLCSFYPGMKLAVGGSTGSFTTETLTDDASDRFTDLVRGRDGSLGLVYMDNGGGIAELTLARSSKSKTSLAYQGPTSAQRGSAVTLSAKLTTGTTALAGRSVTFKLDGVVVGTATTDALGVARRTITVTAAAGNHKLTAGFSGAAGLLAARAGPLAFVVSP